MKNFNIIVLTALSFWFASCSENTLPDVVEAEIEKGVLAIAPTMFDLENDVEPNATRSTLHYNTTTKIFEFAWKANDVLRVFSCGNNNNNNMQYSLESGGGSTSARFTARGFSLTKGDIYYSLYPYNNKAALQAAAILKTAFPISFEDQRQLENDNSDHLGAYDYMAAASRVEIEGFAQFAYKRLVTPLRFSLSGKAIKGKTFTELKLITSNNYDFRYERIIDLTDDDADLADYAPVIKQDPNNLPRTGDKYKFSMKLGPDYGGIQAPVDGSPLVLYMMIPPTKELKDKSIFGVLVEKETKKEYYFAMPGREFIANKPVNYSREPAESDNLNVSLTIKKQWQHGNTQNQTRAGIGDPGVEDNLDKPKYVYIYTCVDNYYSGLTELFCTDEYWKESEDKLSWKFKENIAISLGTNVPSDNIHIYAIASKVPIDRLPVKSSLTPGPSGTNQDDIKNMTLSSTITQDMLKNLYSYDYEIKASDPRVIEATLYHTSAKLDVQWNAASALTTVSVDNLPTSGLYIFKPTKNTATGSETLSITTTTGNQWNGRAVFYVPQFQTPTYTITTGSTQKTITFTPETADGKTSWLKANIRVQ